MITRELFNSLFPIQGLSPRKYNLVRLRDELITALNEFLPKYEINTHKRISAFFGCCGIETDYFKTSKEYASGADYEGRRDLGNVIKGDGKRYPGRSIIQTTGRFNTWRVVVRFIKKLTGKDWSNPLAYSDFAAYLKSPDYTLFLAEADRLGVNFLKYPEKLEEPRIAVEAACIFWQENNLNSYADAKRFKELNGIVNRGNPTKTPLHWAKRNELYSKCIRYVPKDFKFLADNQDHQTLPITSSPAGTAGDTASSIAGGFNFDFSKAETHYSRATATLQRPAVKSVLLKAFWKLAGGLTAVWSTTAGKIAIVLSLIVVLGVAAGIIYSYRKQIQLGWQILKASIAKTLKLQTENQ